MLPVYPMTTANPAIDLNADLGEGGSYDAELLAVVSSCNIACGGHAGDRTSMAATVAAALANGVAIGAHPSYPDAEGFGRRSRYLGGDALRLSLIEQIESLRTIVEEQGAAVSHVKPHGALYHDVVSDHDLAELVVGAVIKAAPGANVVGMSGSELQTVAANHSLRFIAEAFIDRAYRDDGRLVPRSEAGAVHESLEIIVGQAVSLSSSADTLCIHGDTPGCVAAARAVRDALEKQGVEIRAIRRR